MQKREAILRALSWDSSMVFMTSLVHILFELKRLATEAMLIIMMALAYDGTTCGNVACMS